MRLLKFKAKNLFSLGRVEFDLDRRGLVLVTGYSHDDQDANGSGKSTIANKGILWTLFGSTAEGLKADDAINNKVEDATAEGKVFFEDDTGQIYTVIRTRKPNALKLMYGDQDLTQRKQEETQSIINKLLGRDKTTFLQTDFFGQGRETPFLRLTPKNQIEVVESILPMDKLIVWEEEARSIKKDLAASHSEDQQKLLKTHGQVTELSTQIHSLELRAADWERSREDKLKRLASFADAPSSEQLRLELQSETELRDIAAQESAKAEETFREWEKFVVQTQAKVVHIEDKVCPTCNQEIDRELNNKLKLEQVSVQATLANAQEQRGKAGLYRDHCKGQLEIADKKLQEINRKILSLDAEHKNRAEYEQAQSATNPYVEGLAESRARLDEVKQNLANLELSVEHWRQEIAICDFWIKAFSTDMKNYLLQRACPFLEQQTAKHLEGLGNSQLRVSFSTAKLLKSAQAREQFNVAVKSSNGGDSYLSLSGGEKALVSFAVGLALADLAETQVEGASKFLILDEPFTNLGKSNAEKLVNYLTNDLANRRETILLISNEDTLQSLVPNRVHVEKQNGITSVV